MRLNISLLRPLPWPAASRLSLAKRASGSLGRSSGWLGGSLLAEGASVRFGRPAAIHRSRSLAVRNRGSLVVSYSRPPEGPSQASRTCDTRYVGGCSASDGDDR